MQPCILLYFKSDMHFFYLWLVRRGSTVLLSCTSIYSHACKAWTLRFMVQCNAVTWPVIIRQPYGKIICDMHTRQVRCTSWSNAFNKSWTCSLTFDHHKFLVDKLNILDGNAPLSSPPTENVVMVVSTDVAAASAERQTRIH